MSYQSFAGDLNRAARRARGKQANKTRYAREQAYVRLARFLWERGFQIHTVRQLKRKHIAEWVNDMAARGCSKRTIANNLAHARTALEGIDRRPFADKVSNTALGIAGASRAGTKRSMLRDEFEAYRIAIAAIDPGIALALELQFEFGLRAEESVRCVSSLADWERALLNPIGDGFITVIHGTKGGKTRRSPPLDRKRAANTVRRAIDLAMAYGDKLVRKPSLEQAMTRYHYVVAKVGMTGEKAPHSLRYAYATGHLQLLKTAGVSRRQAAAGVSTWLGHGDGRGTWVEQVYGRDALAQGKA
jgi:site-specific recombinase XerC